MGWELERALAPLGRVIAPGRDRCDLTDPRGLRALIAETTPDLVVNAAAYTAVDRAEDEPGRAQAVNSDAPALLADEARRRGFALVHYSTDYVFDGTGTRPYREDDPVGPLGVYGRTKLEGERAVLESGAPCLVLRTAWVYGLRGHNFLLTMLRLAAEGRDLRVVDDQTGAPTWARALAEATAAILAQGAAHPGGWRDCLPPGSLYHLAAGGQTTWHGFARAILDLSGHRETACRAIPTADFPTRALRPAYSVLDCGRAGAAFGVTLPDWQSSLRQCLADRAGQRGEAAQLRP